MKQKPLIFSLILCGLAIVAYFTATQWISAPFLPDGEGLTVYYLDVGQGDATLLCCGGETLLIDGGDNQAERTLPEILTDLDVTSLDYIVCTHPHADHCGGLDAAVETFPFGTVYSPCTDYDTATFTDFAETIVRQGGTLMVPNPDDTFPLGNATVTILGPRWDRLPENVNDWSIILRVDYGDTAFLFTGDGEYAAESKILDADCNVRCNVLKAGHHGSDTSTGYRLLYEAQPQYAVISCGTDNSYGHPHEPTLSRLRDADVTILRTDTQGTVTFHSDGTKLTYTTQNPEHTEME